MRKQNVRLVSVEWYSLGIWSRISSFEARNTFLFLKESSRGIRCMESTRYYRAVYRMPFRTDGSYAPGKEVVAGERRGTEEERATIHMEDARSDRTMNGMPVLHRRYLSMHRAEGWYSDGAPNKNGRPEWKAHAVVKLWQNSCLVSTIYMLPERGGVGVIERRERMGELFFGRRMLLPDHERNDSFVSTIVTRRKSGCCRDGPTNRGSFRPTITHYIQSLVVTLQLVALSLQTQSFQKPL